MQCNAPSGHLARMKMAIVVHTGLCYRGIKRAVVNGLNWNRVKNLHGHHCNLRYSQVEAWKQSKSSRHFSENWTFEMEESRGRLTPKASALRSHSLFHSTPNVQQSYIRVQITNVQRITATYWPTMNGPKQIHTPDPSGSSSTGAFERGYGRNATWTKNMISPDITGRPNIIASTYMPVKAPGRGGQQRNLGGLIQNNFSVCMTVKIEQLTLQILTRCDCWKSVLRPSVYFCESALTYFPPPCNK